MIGKGGSILHIRAQILPWNASDCGEIAVFVVASDGDALSGITGEPHGRFAHQTVEAKEKRLNKVNHAQPQQAKGNERIGAYPAVQVKFLSGIIPPPCVKRLLHDIARQVFQRAAQQHRQSENSQRIIGELAQKQRDQHRSKPVDRTPGADQESSVDKPPKLDQFANHFHAPAQEGRRKE